MKRPTACRLPDLTEHAHAETGPELYFRIALWIAAQDKPTARALQEAFEVHRATAFRYMRAWRAATGQTVAGKVETTQSQPSHARTRGPHPWSRRHDR